jgi:hypothetical protein
MYINSLDFRAILNILVSQCSPKWEGQNNKYVIESLHVAQLHNGSFTKVKGVLKYFLLIYSRHLKGVWSMVSACECYCYCSCY